MLIGESCRWIDGLLESGRKTALHSINKLLIEIAMKQKTFNNQVSKVGNFEG